jgi:hypothetical protein
LIDNTGGEDDDCDDRSSLPTTGRCVFGFKDDNDCDDDDFLSLIDNTSGEGKTFPMISLTFT